MRNFLVILMIMTMSLLSVSKDEGSNKKVKYDDSWGSQGFTLNTSKSSTSGVSLTYSINEFTITEKLINKAMKTTLQLPGVFLQNDEGSPSLPGSARYIAIPQGAKASYTITASKKEYFQ